MKCHNCGADQHLILECDRPKSQSQAWLAMFAPPATAKVPAGGPARGSSYSSYPLDPEIWGNRRQQQQALARGDLQQQQQASAMGSCDYYEHEQLYDHYHHWNDP
eukprot:6485985-Heterocapsa_arctica.AAC.1